MENNVKLFMITASLTPDGLVIRKRDRHYKETEKLFIAQHEFRATQVKKDDLLKPFSRFTNQLGSMINFAIFCKPEDALEAIDIITSRIEDRISFFRENLALLEEGSDKEVTWQNLKGNRD